MDTYPDPQLLMDYIIDIRVSMIISSLNGRMQNLTGILKYRL